MHTKSHLQPSTHYSNRHIVKTDDEWCTQRAKASVLFDFGLKTLSLEVLLLMYIRSLREGDFELYVQSLLDGGMVRNS